MGGPVAARSHRDVPEPRLLRRLPDRDPRAPERAPGGARGRAGAVPRRASWTAASTPRGPRSAPSWAPTPTTSRSSATPPAGSTRCCARSSSRPATSCSPPITPTRPARTRSTTSRGGPARASWWPPLPFPVASPEAVVSAVLAKATSRTRLALLDHITSPTGLILPIERLVAELRGRGRGDAGGRRARARDGPARSARARRRLLQRQLPQVAVHAEGLGLPLGAPRLPARASTR